MKYMLLIHDSEQVWGTLSQNEQKQIMADYRRFTEEIRGKLGIIEPGRSCSRLRRPPPCGFGRESVL